MNKKQKTDFIKKLESELKDVQSVILVNYSGLSVGNQEELKKRLREVDARFLVAKNTLFKIASQNLKFPKDLVEEGVIKGQNALVLADDDPIAPLKIIADFAKEFVNAEGKPIPQIKVGVVEGGFQDKPQLDILTKLGSKSAVSANTLGILASPLYGLVGTLEAKMQELIFTLQAASEKS